MKGKEEECVRACVCAALKEVQRVSGVIHQRSSAAAAEVGRAKAAGEARKEGWRDGWKEMDESIGAAALHPNH